MAFRQLFGLKHVISLKFGEDSGECNCSNAYKYFNSGIKASALTKLVCWNTIGLKDLINCV